MSEPEAPAGADPCFIPLAFERHDEDAMRARARDHFQELDARRSVRDFSSDPIPNEVLEDCLRAASTAPSGAHLQPWHFVVVTDPDLKRQIRAAAEEEERINYTSRMPEDWLEALRPLGTDAVKAHIEDAPAIVVVFAVRKPPSESGRKRNYYVSESVGIATGFLIAALHRAGLATLTHTPNPMIFLRDLLGRPKNETPFVLLPVGYPAEGCQVPHLERKPLDAVRTWLGPR
jgi:iodotyrosine deiodinase